MPSLNHGSDTAQAGRAMKASELADYSVGTVWHVQDRGRKIHLVDLVRGRFEYPELVAAALALWRKWKVEWAHTNLVIEDKGSGSSLIQSLKNERIYAHQDHGKLEGDKVMRLTAQACPIPCRRGSFPGGCTLAGRAHGRVARISRRPQRRSGRLDFTSTCVY
jgi:hypothetical protein